MKEKKRNSGGNSSFKTMCINNDKGVLNIHVMTKDFWDQGWCFQYP